jgi:hypothetical protein
VMDIQPKAQYPLAYIKQLQNLIQSLLGTSLTSRRPTPDHPGCRPRASHRLVAASTPPHRSTPSRQGRRMARRGGRRWHPTPVVALTLALITEAGAQRLEVEEGAATLGHRRATKPFALGAEAGSQSMEAKEGGLASGHRRQAGSRAVREASWSCI